MNESETGRRLRWHAGLGGTGDMAGRSVSDCTAERGGQEDAFPQAFDDFLDTLGRYNHELNGPQPSAAGASDGAGGTIPGAVAYAVAEVARFVRELEARRPDLAAPEGEPSATWLIETAWLAVLAGDIDDVRAHLAEEWAARRPST